MGGVRSNPVLSNYASYDDFVSAITYEARRFYYMSEDEPENQELIEQLKADMETACEKFWLQVKDL